jgi:CRP-like cAMP-binding protein
MNFFAGEYLYLQKEHANEVYFILRGKVLLMYDLMTGTEVPKSFNIPFNMYIEGSYFGDSDVLV